MRTSLAIAMAMLPACVTVAAAQERAARDTAFRRRGCRATWRVKRRRCSTRAPDCGSAASWRSSAGREVRGDVAVLNGPLTIAGHVTGPRARDQLGRVLRSSARIDGDLHRRRRRSGWPRRRGDRRRDSRSIASRWTIAKTNDQIVAERDTLARRARALVAALGAAADGPQLEQAADRIGGRVQSRRRAADQPRAADLLSRRRGEAPRLDAYAILRTGSSFSSHEDDLGHNVRGEVRIGRLEGFALGGRAVQCRRRRGAVAAVAISRWGSRRSSFTATTATTSSGTAASVTASLFARRAGEPNGLRSAMSAGRRATANNPFTLFNGDDSAGAPIRRWTKDAFTSRRQRFVIDTRNDATIRGRVGT